MTKEDYDLPSLLAIASGLSQNDVAYMKWCRDGGWACGLMPTHPNGGKTVIDAHLVYATTPKLTERGREVLRLCENIEKYESFPRAAPTKPEPQARLEVKPTRRPRSKAKR